MQTTIFAALYHGVDWNCPEDSIIVSDGVTMGNLQVSSINKLYKTICENYKVDEG